MPHSGIILSAALTVGHGGQGLYHQRRAAQQDTLWAEVFRAYLRRHPEALDALEEDTECTGTCC